MSQTEHHLPLILPIPVWGTAPVRLMSWLVDPGEPVAEGDILLEAGLPGVVGDLRAPAEGCVSERMAAENTWVTPGELIGWFEPALRTAPDEVNP